ncbi:alginate O-acetyltransferase, partial [Pseudomonas sp. NPDC078863]
PPQVLIWELPEPYLPVNNEIGDADPQWVAELKQAGARQQNVAINTKSETPDRAQN